MKAIKIIVCLTIVVAAIAYAAKVPTVFSPGLEGFLKTKAPAAAFTNIGEWVVFSGLDAKSQLQITKADGASILVNGAVKMIKQKGKIGGTLNNIILGESATPLLDPANPVFVLDGNEKFSVKLKGVNVGTVMATSMKMVLVNDLSGKLAGTNLKGIKVMTQDGGIEGTPAAPVVIGDANVPTMLKLVKAKKGAIGYVDATLATPAKVAKTKWGAKVQSAGTVQVAALADWAEAKKNKNVTLTDGSAPVINVVSGL